jgi:hypothetical protein
LFFHNFSPEFSAGAPILRLASNGIERLIDLVELKVLGEISTISFIGGSLVHRPGLQTVIGLKESRINTRSATKWSLRTPMKLYNCLFA